MSRVIQKEVTRNHTGCHMSHTGATGLQGPQGHTGATGLQGPQGDTGATELS